MKETKLIYRAIVFIIVLLAGIPVIFAAIPDGDVAPLGNRDGQIKVGDALVCLRFSLGLEAQTQEDVEHGDVAPLDAQGQPSPDGEITVGDALVILRKALGLITWDLQDIWSGDGISFTVSGDPPFVTEFSVTYSGDFVGAKCSGPYTKRVVVGSQPGFPIENNAFTGEYESFLDEDTLTFIGTFLDSENAEIVISWDGYDSYCDAEYAGSQTYTATHQ
ncbi:MAG: hypothetical protein U9R17_04690 [Thermodesulfobacteriota bacterium]|nr:hypothetical protein [Thermodesulfobacteriota bacterium]